MQSPPLRIVLGIPGLWEDRTAIVNAIVTQSEGYLFAGKVLTSLETNESFAVDIYEHDPELARAFWIASGQSLTEPEMDALSAHTFTIYIGCDGGSIESARGIMNAAHGLLRAGGLGVKIESSGKAHSKPNWMALANHGGPDALYYAYVALVSGEGNFYSCGMHNLGFRDALVADALDPEEAGVLLEEFLLFAAMENPPLEEGHTFSVTAESPRYRLVSEPCTIYDKESLFYNPLGMWRLAPM